MSILEKFLLLAAGACWVLFYFTKKNAAFGLAFGMTIFALIFWLGDFT